jgi:Spy/CpxP family protein refolding chaperone
MEHGSRTRLVTALVLVAVFGSGLLLGLAADRSLRAAPADAIADTNAAAGENEGRGQRTMLYEQVEPTDEQRTQIDSIVDRHRARTNTLHSASRAQYRADFQVILLETREAIKGVFTPAQAEEYERRLQEWDARPATERENTDQRD